MRILFDTSVLVRLAVVADPNHPVAVSALTRLRMRGFVPVLTPQVLIEYRSVATRPTQVNGLGLSAAVADGEIVSFERNFPLLPDAPDVYPMWKGLVATLGVEGKTVHDARLVAVCHVHAITHILTFNTRHFTRLATFPPGLTLLHPAQV